jgi:hypothetical protein
MADSDGQTPEERDEEINRRPKLKRALTILGVFYVILPLILIYLLFKIFPPNPWFPTDWRQVQMVFLFDRLNIWTTLEERLILLVVVAGALGSYIHSATSYADFRGNRKFEPSWLMWYVLRPFIGVSLALVVYFAIRGGLLSVVLSGDSANDASKINPFGIAAIAGLTGMFSKQAADKLAEVFSTLFQSQGDANRKDSLDTAPAPEIKKIDPIEGPIAGGTNVTLTGTGFTAGATVTFGTTAATKVVVVNETTITADTPAGEGVVDVIVANADGKKATASKAFTYIAASPGAGDAVDSASNAVKKDDQADPEDDESDIDGCDVDITDETPDEELPAAEGGVAS